MKVPNSKTESFKENVELYSKALAVSGFDYRSVKKELLKFEHVDPKDLINEHQIAGNPNQVPRFISTLLLTQDYPTLEKSSPEIMLPWLKVRPHRNSFQERTS